MMKLKMIALIPIAVLITTSSALYVGPTIKIFFAFYDIQELAFPRPYRDLVDLTYERDNKIVYFSYIERDSVNLAFYDYYTGEIEKLEVDANVTCLEIDGATSTLYIGTDNGIKSMMPKHSHISKQLNVTDMTITGLFFNEVLYYTTKDGAFIYESKTGESIRYIVAPIGHFDKFVMDNKGYIIYMNKKKQEAYWLHLDVSETSKFYINVTDVAVDHDYRAYVSTHNALHLFDNEKLELEKVADIKDIDRMAFIDEGVPIFISDGWLRRVSHGHDLCRKFMPTKNPYPYSGGTTPNPGK